MKIKVLISVFFLLIIHAAQGQQPAKKSSIGLVLSGGGARAMSQIGTLQVLDSLGIKIDYIAGTSMGAVLGALYAMGYTGNQIHQMMREVDWDALTNNTIPRNRLSLFDKKNEDKYLFSIPLANGRVAIPSAFNTGHYILKHLTYITQNYAGYQDFSALPIPFLCTGTDIENGQLKIFEQGILADALRASSAFPSLFSPYIIDGRMYVDGGVLDNLPIIPLKKKGIDIIIGVDVQTAAYSIEELSSINRVLEQISTFSNLKKHSEAISLADVLIRPDNLNASLLSFDLIDQLVANGKEAALEQIEVLDSLSKLNYKNETKAAPLPKNSYFIENISIEGNNSFQIAQVAAALNWFPGKEIKVKTIDRFLDELYGSKNYSQVHYSLQKAYDDVYNLTLTIDENPYKAQVRMGINYNDDFGAGLLFSYLQRDILLQNSRFTADFVASDMPRAQLVYFLNMGVIPSLGIKLRTHRFNTHAYNEGRRLNQINYWDFSIDAYLQSTISEVYAIGGGVQIDFIDLNESINVDPFIRETSTYINYYAFMDFDNYDRVFKPRSGSSFNALVRLHSRTDGFETFFNPTTVATARYSQAFSFGPLGFHTSFMGALSFGQEALFPYQIFLGSNGDEYINYINPFLGYQFMEISTQNAITARADMYFQFRKNHYITFKLNYGLIAEQSEDLFQIDQNLINGMGASYAFNSPLGPMELTVMGSTNHSRIFTYLSLGYWF